MHCSSVFCCSVHLYVLVQLPKFYRSSLQWTFDSFETVPKMVVDGGNDEFFLVSFKYARRLFVFSSDNDS